MPTLTPRQLVAPVIIPGLGRGATKYLRHLRPAAQFVLPYDTSFRRLSR
jgi:hypothetical protein